MRYSNPRSPATESRGSRSEVVLKKVELSHWTDRKKTKKKTPFFKNVDLKRPSVQLHVKFLEALIFIPGVFHSTVKTNIDSSVYFAFDSSFHFAFCSFTVFRSPLDSLKYK